LLDLRDIELCKAEMKKIEETKNENVFTNDYDKSKVIDLNSTNLIRVKKRERVELSTEQSDNKNDKRVKLEAGVKLVNESGSVTVIQPSSQSILSKSSESNKIQSKNIQEESIPITNSLKKTIESLPTPLPLIEKSTEDKLNSIKKLR